MTKRTVSESATTVDTLSRWPADVVMVIAFLVVVNAVFVVVDPEAAPIRVLLAGPLLLFLPGYVIVSALFPWSSNPAAYRPADRGVFRQFSDVNGPERAALSFGLSLAVLPVFGLLVAFSPWGYTATAVIPLLSAFVAVGAIVSTFQRQRVPVDDRFGVSLAARAGSLRRFLTGGGTASTAVNAALVVAVLLAMTSIGYALAAPQDGERFSDLQLLTETEDGEYVAGEYPEALDAGAERSLVVGVENREHERTEYTVVTRVERVDAGDGAGTVVDAEELRRTSATLDHGEVWHDEHTVAPEMTGEDLRISYYLYRGDAPDDVGEESAYRHVYLWVEVR